MATFEQLWVICNEASDNSLLSIRSIPLGSNAIVVTDNGEMLLTKAEVEEFGCASEPLKCSQKGKHSQKRSTTVRPLSSDFANDDDESDTPQDHQVSTSSGSTWVLSGSHSRLALPMAEDHRVSTSSGSTQVLSGSCSRLSSPLAEDHRVSTTSGC